MKSKFDLVIIDECAQVFEIKLFSLKMPILVRRIGLLDGIIKRSKGDSRRRSSAIAADSVVG
jgi:hypothetical protein